MFTSPRYSLSIHRKLLFVEIVLFPHSPHTHFMFKTIFFITDNILMPDCDRFDVVDVAHNLNRLQMLLIAGRCPQRKQWFSVPLQIISVHFSHFQRKPLIFWGLNSLKKSNIQLDPFWIVQLYLSCTSELQLVSRTAYTKFHLVKLLIAQIGRRIFLQVVYIKRQFQILNFFLNPIIYLE